MKQQHSPANRPLARDLRAARTTRSSSSSSPPPHPLRERSTPGRAAAANHSAAQKLSSLVEPPATLREKSASRAAPPRAADITPTFLIPAAVRTVAVVNERVAWTVDVDGAVQIRALPKGSIVKQVDTASKESVAACCLLYLPTLQRIWVALRDGSLRIYDATTGQLTKALAGRHRGPVHCLLALEDTVCTGGCDWRVHQYEAETAQYRRLFFGHAGAVRCLGAYSGPTGAVLFSGSDDATIKAWNPYAPPPKRTAAATIGESTSPVDANKRYRSMSSDEEEESNGGDDETACLYTFQGHTRAVLALEVVPHAHQLWSGGEDTTVRVWDLSTLQLSKTLTGHTAPVSCLLTVESRMWSGDKHGSLLLWDMSSLSALRLLARYGSNGVSAMPPSAMLSMTKIELCTAWRVWTTYGQGWVQSWCAETQPIVLEKEPVLPFANMASSNNNSKAVEGDASQASSTGGAAWQRSRSSADAVVLHTPNTNALASLASASPAEGPTMAWMHAEIEQYMQRLQTELNATKQELAFSYEQARKEVQHELILQQLLMEENAMLKAQLQQQRQQPAVQHADEETYVDAAAAVAASIVSDTPPAPLPARVTGAPVAASETSDTTQATTTTNMTTATTTTTNATPVPQLQNARTPATTAQSRGAMISSHHRRRFAGHNWAYLLTEKPHELYSTFRDEVSSAFGVPASQLANIRFHEGSLVAELDVRHSASISPDEMARRLREYDFARLLELHDQALVKPKVGLDAAQDTLRHLERAVRHTTHALQRVTGPAHIATTSHTATDKRDDAGNNNSNSRDDAAAAPTQAELQLLREENAALQRILQHDRSGLTTATGTEGQVSVSDLSSLPAPVEHVTRGTQHDTPLATRQIANAAAHADKGTQGGSEDRASEAAVKERLVAREAELRVVKAQLAHLRDENARLHVQLEALADGSQAQQEEIHTEKTNEDEAVAAAPPLSRPLPIAHAALPSVDDASQAAGADNGTLPHDDDELYAQLREDHAALDDYLHMRLKPLISRLKRTRGEKEYLLGKLQEEKSALEQELREVRAELQTARGPQPAELHSPPPRSPHRHNTGNVATNNVNDDDDDNNREEEGEAERRQPRRDTAHEETVSPLHESAARRTASQQAHSARASAVMQAAEAELAALERATELQRRAASEAMPDVVDQLKAAQEQQQQAQGQGNDGKEEEQQEEEEEKESEAVRELREDYAALEQYVHMRLKPLISRLKRARGERDVLLAEADKRYATLLELYNAARSANTVAAAAAKDAAMTRRKTDARKT